MRAKHIYNKNAREKALLEEAYSQVNEGHAGPEVQVGSHVMWDRQRRFGIVDKVDDPENPTVAVVLDDDGAESIVDVKHLKEISGPIEDQEDPDHDRHLEPSHGHGAAYVEDDPLEPSWDAEWSAVDALADILAELANTWQEGKYSDADKESLKKYINDFIDEEIDDRKIDDAPLPDHPAGNAWPLGRAAAIRDAHPLFYK